MIRARSRECARGITYIELLVAMVVLMVLAGVAIPMARWDQKRRLEGRLRGHLVQMRAAIDQYKKLADEGLIIMTDVDQRNYPTSLEELVEGVEVGDPRSPEARVVRFLSRIPVDPMTGEAEWGLRSYQDDFDSRSWGGENVYDVYSLSDRRALDDTFYEDW